MFSFYDLLKPSTKLKVDRQPRILFDQESRVIALLARKGQSTKGMQPPRAALLPPGFL